MCHHELNETAYITWYEKTLNMQVHYGTSHKKDTLRIDQLQKKQ